MTETRAPFNGKKKEPAGVFIRLHDGALNAKQIALLCRPNRSFTENILAISSPAIGREMDYEATVAHYEAKLAERDADIARLQAKQPHYDRMVQENGELKLAVARLQAQDDKEITQVIEERDEREQVIDDLYQAVMGDSPEWSNNFGYRDAVEDVVDYVHALRTKALKGPEA